MKYDKATADDTDKIPLFVQHQTSKSCKAEKRHKFVVLGFVIGVGIVIGLAIFFGLYFGLSTGQPNVPTPSPPVAPIHSKWFQHAAVAADAAACSTIGKEILQKGGSVVDSAIASMLCVGLYNAQSSGIGGGAIMTVYKATSKKATVINFKDMAPMKATTKMYTKNPNSSELGTLAVGVPGQIAGYCKAHQMFGVLPWKELFEPAIKIAQEGLVVSTALANAINSSASYIHNRTFNLWPVFENDDGTLKVEGDIVRRPQLAKTLQIIADEGVDAFYNGTLAQDIVKDLNDGFGDNIITEMDLQNYEVKVENPVQISIDGLTYYGPGLPASGVVLALILNILQGYNLSTADLMDEKLKILTYHRIDEAFRFAYAKRSYLGDDENNPNITKFAEEMITRRYADSLRSKINDSTTHPVEYYEPDFPLPEDHGTSHMSIIGANGDAVSFTSSINLFFGCKVRGIRTGIIFNNGMNDFSSPNLTNYFGIPPSPSNFIKPGHRAMSSMCPTIVVQENPSSVERAVKMVVGAAGGSEITTSTSLTILNSLFFGYDAGTSVEMKRLHDQLLPNVSQFEIGFDQVVVDGLKKKGHNVLVKKLDMDVQAIVVNKNGWLDAACDSRKGGIPDGY